jgi:hypothetical protein
MAAVWIPGTGILWHGNFKVNTIHRGFSLKFHVPNVDEATARGVLTDIGLRLLKLYPPDTEIFFAAVSKDDSDKDSRYLPGVVGAGQYAPVVVPPVVQAYDMPQTSLLVRIEHDAGSSVTRKIGPIPDTVLNEATTTSVIAPVVGVPAAVPAPGAGADWFAEFTNLMAALVKNTKAIKSGHEPGGAFFYANNLNAFMMRAGVKKGGHVFI